MYKCTIIRRFIYKCTLLHFKQGCMMEQEDENGMNDNVDYIDCDDCRYSDEEMTLSKPCIVI
jgi:hypothetical protein